MVMWFWETTVPGGTYTPSPPQEDYSPSTVGLTKVERQSVRLQN